ncbi:MAG: peptidoglycan D,D-transpeptidase FtsI family protein [Planctomycetota bacterium]
MTSGERLRVRFLFGALGCVPVFLAGWLGWVQVLQAGELQGRGRTGMALSARAADTQRDRGEALPGPRGTIVDRHGAALAMDCESFEVRAEIRLPRAARSTCEGLRDYCADLVCRLADALSCDPGLADRGAAHREHCVRLLQRLDRAFGLRALPARGPLPDGARRSGEILVATDVAVLPVIEQLLALDAEKSSLLLHLQHDHTRVYPARELTYGLIGYVEDAPLRADDGRLLGFEARAPMGLEALPELAPGAPGRRPFLVDSQHRRFYAGTGEPAAAAARVESTIDLELQKAAARQLEQHALAAGTDEGGRPQWGALVLVEVDTGDVLAAASWHRDVEHPRGAAFAPYQQLYEPGSIVKPLVFAYALQHGGLDWHQSFDCHSSGHDHRALVPEVNGRLVRDDHPCGVLTPHEILVFSSNIGAVKVGSLLSRDEWRRYLDVFGFGASLGLELPHERVGGPSPLGWRKDVTAAAFKKWTGSSYSIGYELQVNALQMARAYLVLLTGRQQPLRLIRAIEYDGQRHEVPVVPGPREFDPAVVEAVTAALGGVVTDGEGATGRHVVAAFRKEGIELPGLLAGKTGTAKSLSTVPGRGSVEVRNASFVGFVPAAAPRYLAVCVLQKDDSARFYGGSYAAPPAARLLLEALRLEQRRRPDPGPQVSASPGSSGRSWEAPETSQTGRR